MSFRLLAAAFFPALASATVVYTDLSAGSPQYSSSGVVIANNRSYAGSFTPGANYTLTEIDVAANSSNTAQPLTVALYADSGGDTPGATALESFTFNSVSGTTSLIAAMSLLTPTLDAGSLYWVVLSTSDAGQYGWSDNNTGALGEAVNLGSGWTDYSTSGARAFDVLGTLQTATPEPSSAQLLLLGAAVLAFPLMERRSLRLIPMVMVFASASRAYAGACTVDTLANYEALGSSGCTVDGVAFANFSLSSTLYQEFAPTQLAWGPQAVGVEVRPVIDSNGPGLEFDSAWGTYGSSSQFEFIQSLLAFSVTAPTGSPGLTGWSITSSGVIAWNLTGSGAVAPGGQVGVESVLCYTGQISPAPCSGGGVSEHDTFIGTPTFPGMQTRSHIFTTRFVPTLGTEEELDFSSSAYGASGIIATASSFTFQYQFAPVPTPEPPAAGLFVLGAFALVIPALKRHRSGSLPATRKEI